MHEWQRQSHVRWECKYHVVIIPIAPNGGFRTERAPSGLSQAPAPNGGYHTK